MRCLVCPQAEMRIRYCAMKIVLSHLPAVRPKCKILYPIELTRLRDSSILFPSISCAVLDNMSA